MAAEGKYGRVTTSKGSIGEDEPVFLLRARDSLAAEAIDYYRIRCAQEGSSQEHRDDLSEVLQVFEAWQGKNGTRVPR